MLEITGLSAAYTGNAPVIDNLSLKLNDGENVALIGANGAGKTTLMLAIVGVIPSRGTISVDGLVLGKKTLNEIRSRVGVVFQNPDDQLFMASVYDDVAFGPRNMGLGEDETDKRVKSVMEKLGISRLSDRSSLKLSGGEKRLAAIAAVLAMRPSVLLFDEPTAFLDLKARRGLIRVLNEMPHAKLISGHDLPFLEETCQRAVIMKDGRIYADGNVRELINDRKIMEYCDM